MSNDRGKHEVAIVSLALSTDEEEERLRDAIEDAGFELRTCSESVEEDFGVFSDE